MIFETGVSIIVTLTIGGALLDGSIVELKLCLEGKRTTGDSIFETARVDELCVRIYAWGLGWIVPGKERCRCGG
jgi:hypothetical protein